MKRIILHWTAGGPVPNSHEKKCYHFLIDTLGNIHKGDYPPEANLNCNDGEYAQHTGGGNTSAIGVALCGMAGFKNETSIGCCPITRVQFEAAMKLCAQLSLKYYIPISSSTILTHYEFGLTHPSSSSKGKIDITYLPPFAWLNKNEIGRFIRSKIKWYVIQLSK